MTTRKQLRNRGLLLLSVFAVVFVIIFLPVFPGTEAGSKVDGLDFMDNFFNQLSKGSAYYIPELQEDAQEFAGKDFTGNLIFTTVEQATVVQKLFATNLITAQQKNETLEVQSDFSILINTILQDADVMYHNDGREISNKYGMDERVVLYGWHTTMKAINSSLVKQKKFEESKLVTNSMNKGVEPAYNYYQIEAKPVKQALGLLIFSLVFYIVYTVWYGFGLLYLFEGMGIDIS